MKLNTEEAELFFELTWALQFFVNRKKEVIPDIHSIQDFKELPQERRFQVREALYESPELIDAYVAQNPDEFDSKPRYWYYRRGRDYQPGDLRTKHGQ